MSDTQTSPAKSAKMILGTLGIFVLFGFLALILSGFAGHESVEDKVYQGEFSKETTEARWKNLEEVQKVQNEAFDQTKVDAAFSKVVSSASKPAKTELVIPGSPTFLKQAEAPSAPAAEAITPAPAAATAPKTEAPAKPAPVEAAPVKAAPAKPAPAKPAPVEAAPAKPAPVKPAPAKPAPAKPAPEMKAPVKPSTEKSVPAKPAAKAKPAAETKAPAKPAPKESAPEKPKQ